MANLEIKTHIKNRWIELTITEGNTTITYDIWKGELEDIKAHLENAIEDINYMIQKLENE